LFLEFNDLSRTAIGLKEKKPCSGKKKRGFVVDFSPYFMKY